MTDTCKRLFIWGAGDQAQVVAETALRTGYEVVAFVDDSNAGGQLFGVPILSESDGRDAVQRQQPHAGCFVGIGDNAVRLTVFASLVQMGLHAPVLVDPSAVVHRETSIGPGTIVGPGASVITGARLGSCCIVNTGATVDHHCVFGDAVHLSPGAHVGGRVVVGSRTWIGLGAAVRNGVRIGDDTIVGAGSAVVNDLEGGIVAYGVPARMRRRTE